MKYQLRLVAKSGYCSFLDALHTMSVGFLFNFYMYVCIMYVRMYVGRCECADAWLYVFMCARVGVCVFGCVYVSVCVCACVCVRMQVYGCSHVNGCVRGCMYALYTVFYLLLFLFFIFYFYTYSLLLLEASLTPYCL